MFRIIIFFRRVLEEVIIESRVGSKGELFPPKKVRDSLRLRPGDRVFFEVKNGVLLVRLIPDVLGLLKRPALGPPEKPEDIEAEMEAFQKDQISKSTKEE